MAAKVLPVRWLLKFHMSADQQLPNENYFVAPCVLVATGTMVGMLCFSINLLPAVFITIVGLVFAMWDFYFRYKQKGVMGWIGKHDPPIAPQILIPTWYYASNMFALGLTWMLYQIYAG